MSAVPVRIILLMADLQVVRSWKRTAPCRKRQGGWFNAYLLTTKLTTKKLPLNFS